MSVYCENHQLYWDDKDKCPICEMVKKEEAKAQRLNGLETEIERLKGLICAHNEVFGGTMYGIDDE